MIRSLTVFFLLLISFTFTSAQDIKSYIVKGDSLVEKRAFTQAINIYHKALDLKPERIITEKEEVDIFLKLGIAYTDIAEYQKALTYFFKYLDKDVVKSNDSLLSNIYNSIGVNYNYLNQIDQALKFYKKSIEVSGKDSIKIGSAYNNMANIYHDKKEYELSEEYYKKALFYFDKKNFYKGVVASVMNLGIIEMESNRMETSLEYLNKAKKLALEKHDTITYIVISINLGDYYTKVGDYQSSEEYLNWALENAKKQNARLFISESYKSLVKLYKKKKDFEKAFNYLELFKANSDSIFHQNSDRDYAELEAKYSLREKDKEMQLLKNEQKYTEAQVKAQEKYTWVLSGLVAFAILFLGLLISQRAKRSKSRLLLEAQNKEIKKSKKQLQDLNRQYEKLIDKYEGQSTSEKI